jgi:Rap guanine nucleotide exchange factor 1
MNPANFFVFVDSNLFLRIDSAELLIWVQEQSEEKCPNLTKFTEHFNNMSYWTRTLILNQPDGKVSYIRSINVPNVFFLFF